MKVRAEDRAEDRAKAPRFGNDVVRRRFTPPLDGAGG